MKQVRSRTIASFIAAATLLGSGAHAGIELVVTAPSQAPPPQPVERHDAAPFRDAVWVDGRWNWRGGRYLWIAGHWQHAPSGFKHWRHGEWDQRDGRWYWSPGRWW